MQIEQEIDYDFLRKNETKSNISNISKFTNFLNINKKIAITLGVVIAVSVGSATAYKIHESNIDKNIAVSETVIKSTNQPELVSLISKEKSVTEKLYVENQILINDHAKYKEVIEILQKQTNLNNMQVKNSSLYKQNYQMLNNDLSSIENVYNTLSKDRDEKIKTFLNSKDFENFNKWSKAVKENQFVYVGGLINLNKDLKEDITSLAQTQKDIIEHVQQRLKNKDFDLNAAQNKFSTDIKEQTGKELKNIQDAKNELTELSKVQVEDEDGNVVKADANIQNILSDKDVNEAKEALGDYENQAVKQVTSDREKVEKLMKDVQNPFSQSTTQQSSNIPTNTTNNVQQSPQVIVQQRGPSFFDYYLMYSWMNAVSSPTVHQTIVTHQYNQPSGMSQPINNASYKAINVPHSSPYDMTNPNSHLNKNLNISSNNKLNSSLSKIETFNKTKSFSEIRTKIDNVRAKTIQAKTVRLNELGKLKAINKHESFNYKPSKSSSSSFKPSGSRSGGFGGSRSFGGSSSR
jgi:enamine deaminase RidA (YjgF/YER057c/UK114 family)